MKQGKGLKISASVITLLLGGSLYYVLRDRTRAKLAKELLTQLKNRLNPSSLGLINEKAFDVRYKDRVLQAVTGQLLIIKESRARALAMQIEQALPTYWIDNEKEVLGIFRSLADKLQVSQIASAYQQLYRISLTDKLASHLNKEQISTLLRSIQALPDYRVL